jgi:hypothetical protein
VPAETEFKARPTLYKGIQMRSRLEADFASTLGRHGQTWKYEPTCFAADGVQWLPDFGEFMTFEGKTYSRYIEVKPAAQFLWEPPTMTAIVEKIDAILTQMSVAWESEPDAGLALALHTYGRDFPDFEISGSCGRPWMCVDSLTPNAMFLIWPGMGQQGALPSAPESARERRRANA